MIRTSLTIACAAAVCCMGGVAEYVDNTSPAAKCASMIIMRPVMDETRVNANLKDDERADAANAITSAVGRCYRNHRVISAEEIKDIAECTSPVVVIQVADYHTKSERMGQKSGDITIKLAYFHTAQDSAPYEVVEFRGKSGRNWGDSTPFKEAVDKVADRISCRKAK